MHEKPGLRVELVLLRPIDALSGALGCSDMIGTRVLSSLLCFPYKKWNLDSLRLPPRRVPLHRKVTLLFHGCPQVKPERPARPVGACGECWFELALAT